MGVWGLFSVSPPSIRRSWNGTIILHNMKQPHEQCTHSDGHSLCLSAVIMASLSTERCPLWGRLRAQASFGWRNWKETPMPPLWICNSYFYTQVTSDLCFFVRSTSSCVVLCKYSCSILSLIMALRGLGKSIALRWAIIEERILKFWDHRHILTKEKYRIFSNLDDT